MIHPIKALRRFASDIRSLIEAIRNLARIVEHFSASELAALRDDLADVKEHLRYLSAAERNYRDTAGQRTDL